MVFSIAFNYERGLLPFDLFQFWHDRDYCTHGQSPYQQLLPCQSKVLPAGIVGGYLAHSLRHLMYMGYRDGVQATF
jgi:hypothetical protein